MSPLPPTDPRALHRGAQLAELDPQTALLAWRLEQARPGTLRLINRLLENLPGQHRAALTGVKAMLPADLHPALEALFAALAETTQSNSPSERPPTLDNRNSGAGSAARSAE